MGDSGANVFGGTTPCGPDGCQESWYKLPEIGKPVRSCLKHNDGNRVGSQVLLKREVSIHRNEHIEMFAGKGQHSPFLIVVQPSDQRS
jgi:hypothetical protein